MKKNINLIIIFLLITSCTGFKLKKETSGDEFLVEKKSPLVVPPNYGQLPLPDSEKKEKSEVNESEIKELIIKKNSKKTENTGQKKDSSLEKSILDKIQ
jgi:hypothetical protein|tara:strand:- start:504 stop:800 length:297 start_codon:yes stop_codon:yes gene_type:complete